MDRVIGIIIRVIVWLAKYTKVLAKLGIGEYEEWKQGEKIKFLLIGYNGARNTGADARVIAMVEQIENLYGKEQVEISVMTLDKETMKGYFHENIRLIQFSSIFLGEIYKECSRHHVAILCEGSTLKSTFANALTMCFCEAAGIMKNQHKPCIAYGSEVGDMEGFLQKMAQELCRDTYFIVRTEESYGRLKELGLCGHVGTDTAWTFRAEQQYEWAREELKKSGWNGKDPILGVAVINPFWWPVKPSLLKWVKTAIARDISLQFNKWYFFSDSKERRAMYERYTATNREQKNIL